MKYKTRAKSSRQRGFPPTARIKPRLPKVNSFDLAAQSTVDLIKTVLFSLGEAHDDDDDDDSGNLMYFSSPKNQIKVAYKVERGGGR